MFASYDAHLNLALIEDAGHRGDIYSSNDLLFRLQWDSPKDLAVLKIENSEIGDQKALKGPGVQILFHPNTAFVSHVMAFEESTKALYGRQRFANPQQYEGGISLPAVSVSEYYKTSETGEQRLSMANIFLVKKARFNQEISPEELYVPVPKGATISDVTSADVNYQRRFTTTEDIADLLTVPFPPRPLRLKPTTAIPQKKSTP